MSSGSITQPSFLFPSLSSSSRPLVPRAAVVVRPRFVWGRGDSVMRPMLSQQFNDGSWRWITPLAVSSTSHVINVCHALRLAAQARGRGQRQRPRLSSSFKTCRGDLSVD